jgi:hypothetical protein
MRKTKRLSLREKTLEDLTVRLDVVGMVAGHARLKPLVKLHKKMIHGSKISSSRYIKFLIKCADHVLVTTYIGMENSDVWENSLPSTSFEQHENSAVKLTGLIDSLISVYSIEDRTILDLHRVSGRIKTCLLRMPSPMAGNYLELKILSAFDDIYMAFDELFERPWGSRLEHEDIHPILLKMIILIRKLRYRIADSYGIFPSTLGAFDE